MPPADVNAQAKNAIAKREETHQKEVMSLTSLVHKRAAEIYNDDRAKEFAGALTAAGEKNNKLKQCTPSSILTAMVACVQIDLMPNTIQGLAYLIPYGKEVQFQLGYQGLVELCYRSGEVESINAELVFPEDVFDFSLGTQRTIKHKPDMTRDRTNIDEATHVYATAKLKNGGVVFDVMSMSEINKIRSFVKAKSTDAPWKVWPEQMAKKTAVKRLTKYLPKSKDDKRLALAIKYDDWAEAGKLTYKDGNIIEGEKPKPAQDSAPRKELKSFAKPPTIKQEDQDTPNPEPVVTQEGNQEVVDNSPYPDTPVAPAKTEEEYRDEIKDMLSFLKISKANEMRTVNDYAKTPLLDKVKMPELRDIYDHYLEIAEAKTEALANPESVPEG